MGICERIAQIRVELAGERGKAAFARKLEISPTTYQSYERGRVPPADVLVRIADLAGVDLRWLLTGHNSTTTSPAADNPALRRAAVLLGKQPKAAAAMAAFVDILTQSMAFPSKTTPATPAGHTQTAPVAATDHSGQYQSDNWIPILGRSAAGVPCFWADHGGEPPAITSLQDLMAGHTERLQRHVRSAEAHYDDPRRADPVQIITLTAPEDGQTAEFIAAASIKNRYQDAFAVRIDGDSMSPQFLHGDLVILSPSAPAADAQAAVVQLDDQIGVTCKLYQSQGQNIHLSPINELFPAQTFAASSVRWALRVLARVRP